MDAVMIRDGQVGKCAAVIANNSNAFKAGLALCMGLRKDGQAAPVYIYQHDETCSILIDPNR